MLKLMRCHSEAVERLRRAVKCLLCADGELQAPAGVKRMALRKAVEVCGKACVEVLLARCKSCCRPLCKAVRGVEEAAGALREPMQVHDRL